MKNKWHAGNPGLWALGRTVGLMLALIFGAAEVVAQTGPSITQQPQSQTNVVGSTAIFRVSATGTAPLSYRWRKGGTNLVDGGRISGSTTTNLTISNVQTNDAGNYSVMVSNQITTITSLTAVLTVPVTNTYTVNVGVGLNLIANQVDRGGNTLSEVLPSVPAGSRLYKFNNANQFWQAAVFTTAWQPATITLSPGEGAFLESPSNFILTFTGIRRTPILPISIPPGLCYLLSRQTPDPGNFDLITGLTPRGGDMVHKWNKATAAYDTFLFNAAGAWQPSPPTTAVGEAAWICPQGGVIPNAPPSISDILNQSTLEDVSINSLPFTIADLETPAANLILSATSTNTTLVPITAITFGGSGNNRNVTIAPAGNQSGTTLITVTVRDSTSPAAGTASDSFLVTVSAINDPPTISNILDQNIAEDGTTGLINFTIGDVDSPITSLVLSAATSNPILVPLANIVFGGGGNSRTVTVSPAANQTGTNIVTVTVTDNLGGSTNDTFQVIVNPVNDLPTISNIQDQTIAEDGTTGLINFTVGDVETAAGSLVLSATTSNPSLVPLANIVFGGGGNGRNVTVTPAPNQSGTNVVTVTVTDGNGGSTNDTFVVIINPVNDLPTISNIADRTINEDTNTGQISFTIGDAETAAGNLVLSAGTSNPTLVPLANIVFGGSGNNRNVTVSPAANQSGTNVVTVTVTDGNGASTNDTFILIISPVNDLPTISNIPDQNIAENGNTGQINFTIGDVETAVGNLVLSAGTSNPNLVPLGNIVFGGSGSNRNVTVTAAPNQSGTNVVTVTVTDGNGGSTNDTFRIIVSSSPPLIVSVDALCLRSNLIVAFSKPVDPVSSLNTSRYVVTAARGTVPVLSVELSADPRILTLHLGGPLTPHLLYTLTATVIGTTGGTGVSTNSFNCAPCMSGSAGKEFWLTFPGNYAINPLDTALPLLLISGEPGTTGTVSVPGLSPPFTDTFLIPAEGTTGLLLPGEADLGGANDVTRNNGVRVTADRPITVYGVNFMPYSTEGYLALPVPALGRAHVVMTYQNLSIGAQDLNGVQLGVVATDDGTTVTIVPSAQVGTHPAGVPFTRTLQRGQTFQLLNTNATPIDLTGTFVFADKPIAVFGSHQCASVPSTNNVFLCNHIIEQMPPTQLWGTEFLTMPLAGRSGGDTFRFMALSSGAVVSVNGVPIPGLLNPGQFHEVRLNQPAHIAANRPILVAQFANSSDFDSVTNSDPLMVLIPPTRLFASEYKVPIGFPDSYVNIVAPTGTVVLVNGNPVLLNSPIAASGYSGATAPVSAEESPSVSLSSVNGELFGVIVYGWELYDAYGFPGGLCQMSDQAQPPPCVCPPSQVSVALDNNCNPIVPDMRQYLGDCYLFVTQNPPAGQALRFGSETVTTTVFDLLGNRADCVTTVTGFSDIVTNCVTPPGTRVQYTVPACGTNGPTLTCNPPPGSLFPPGVTTVNCVGPLQTGGSFNVTVRCLSITLELPDQVIVTFEGGGTLEISPTPSGPWSPLPEAKTPFVMPIKPDEQNFFRVRY